MMGVVIAFLTLRSEQRRERRIEREAQQKRHEDNLAALEKVRLEIATLKHLDDCMDEVKDNLKELHDVIYGRVIQQPAPKRRK